MCLRSEMILKGLLLLRFLGFCAVWFFFFLRSQMIVLAFCLMLGMGFVWELKALQYCIFILNDSSEISTVLFQVIVRLTLSSIL